MIGRNELKLCAAEMLVALQEYIDKRWGAYSPKAIDVQHNKDMYTITLEGKSGTVPISPPLMPAYPRSMPTMLARYNVYPREHLRQVRYE
jgi:hypothetical protein